MAAIMQAGKLTTAAAMLFMDVHLWKFTDRTVRFDAADLALRFSVFNTPLRTIEPIGSVDVGFN